MAAPQGRKQFFFEKKNQKTFDYGFGHSFQSGITHAA
jgi:hypothetical protein